MHTIERTFSKFHNKFWRICFYLKLREIRMEYDSGEIERMEFVRKTAYNALPVQLWTN